MSPVVGRRLAIALATLSVGIAIASTAMAAAMGRLEFGGFVGALVIAGSIYPVVGAFVIVRAAGNRVGWLLLAAGLLWAADLLLNELAWFGTVTAPGRVPGADLALWASNWVWPPGTTILMFGVPLLFPDGHLPSPRWRATAMLAVVILAVDVLGHALAAWPLRGDPNVLLGDFNASNVPGIAGLLSGIGDTSTFLLLPLIAIPAVVVRYRRSRGVARLQMRWFLMAILIFFVLVISDLLVAAVAPAAQGVPSAVAIGWLPVAISVAILRYRLWEVDRILSRTVSYAVVTAVLAAVFLATNLALQGALSQATGESTLAVAASTLLVAGLFTPVRRRVQAPVDRRFNRSRVDAERVVAGFAAEARDTVDLAALQGVVEGTVRRAVAPDGTNVWLRRGTRT
jgi:hypothetical protein